MSTETHAVALVAASSRWRPRTLAHLDRYQTTH